MTDLLSGRSRHRAAKVYRLGANPGVQDKGAGPGGEPRSRLRSWPPERRSGRTSAWPCLPSGSGSVVARRWGSCNPPLSRSGLFASFTGFFQLAIAFLGDDRPQAIQLVCRGDVPHSAVQADVVVMLDVRGHAASGFLETFRAGQPNALGLDALMPALQLAVGLRVVGARPHVGDAHQADELLEIPGDELRPVIADDPRPGIGIFLQGALHDLLHILLLHGLANLPMHDVAAVAVEQRAQEVECAVDVEIRDVDVPVLVWPQRLHKTGAFLGRRRPAPIKPAGVFEHAVGAGGTDGHGVIVQHHERQPPVAFQRMAVVEVKNGLFFPVLEPGIARDLAVVFIDFAVALLPVVELAGAQREPAQEPAGRQLRAHGPVADVVHDLVARIVGNPASLQSSPVAFFARTFSSINSAITSFFCTSLASSCSIRRSLVCTALRAPADRSKARWACSSTWLIQVWIRLGWTCNSSASLEIGSLPPTCLRTTWAF